MTNPTVGTIVKASVTDENNAHFLRKLMVTLMKLINQNLKSLKVGGFVTGLLMKMKIISWQITKHYRPRTKRCVWLGTDLSPTAMTSGSLWRIKIWLCHWNKDQLWPQRVTTMLAMKEITRGAFAGELAATFTTVARHKK